MLKPTAGKERIADLDYIRGFALIGILLVNMPLFSGDEYQTYTGADRVIRLIFDLFVQAKFYTIFSFLFGVGFYLFVSRALVKGYSLNLYKKRITGLLLIGLVHLIFFWKGDILAIYAVSGFLAVPFFRKEPYEIRNWGFVLIGVFLIVFVILPSLMAWTMQPSSGKTDPELMRAFDPEKAEQTIRAFQQLSLWEWVKWRFQYEVLDSFVNQLVVIPNILGLFLLGLYAGKIGLFSNAASYRQPLHRIQIWMAALSLPSLTAIILLYAAGEHAALYNQTFVTVSGFTLGIGYIVTLILLLQNSGVKRWLKPLSAYGQMALTNYLLHTVISVSLFVPGHLYRKIGLRQGVLISVFLTVIQITLSNWWLCHFRFGPAEWAWRCFTYGQLQPLKKSG